MTGLTTLKALTLITKLYTGYAYSLAFIFQSSLVLIMAVFATIGYILIKERAYQYNKVILINIKHPQVLNTARHTHL